MNTRSAFHLACIATAFAFIVVALGAWTRLVDAGLGCPDWPGCYGQLTAPASDRALAQARALYPDNAVEFLKAQTEMVHRYAAGLLGLMIFLLAGISLAIKKKNNAYPVMLTWALVLLVVLQAAAGALTVTLKLWPQIVVVHLIGGFLTLGLLAVLTYRLSGWQSQPLLRQLGWGKLLGALMLALLLFQIALGGWVSAQYAGIACPDLPTCQGQWWPDANWQNGFQLFTNSDGQYLGGTLDAKARMAIHLAHRLGGIAIVLYFFGAIFLLYKWGLSKNWVLGLLGLVSAQFILGLANVLFSLPIAIATAHNGLAALLFVFTLLLNSQLNNKTLAAS